MSEHFTWQRRELRGLLEVIPPEQVVEDINVVLPELSVELRSDDTPVHG